MVLVYSMKILFQVLYISNLKYFLEGIYVLTLPSNIQIYSKFCLTLVQASSEIMMTLFVCFVDN